VNKESASGSEILAGAFQDNERAEVIGETTLGTGTVLDEYPLGDGSVILLAVAEWLRPNREPIREIGIVPDVEAGMEEGQKPRTPDEIRGLSGEEILAEDPQLGRALEVLQKA
jgi:carboxyl-terminal processing protease